MQLEKIISTIPSDQINFIDYTVTYNGRSKVIKVAEQMKPQGRPSALDTVNGKQIDLYNQFLVEQTEFEIAKTMAEEEKAQEDLELQLQKKYEEKEAELKARFNLVQSRSEKKKADFTKSIVRTGVTLLALIGVFSFAINFINLETFFGDTMGDKFGSILANFILIVISLLISVSFAFFAVLRNGKMVKKTLWILPADLLLAFFISTGILSGAPEMWIIGFKLLTCLIYVGQIYFIALEISNLFVGTGIEKGKEKEHYEKVFNTIFA